MSVYRYINYIDKVYMTIDLLATFNKLSLCGPVLAQTDFSSETVMQLTFHLNKIK